MLRITLESSAAELTYKLEGKLAGPWVAELDKSWSPTASFERKRIIVDLSQVTYVDVKGEELLTWMCRRGAVLKASDCMMKCLVERIKRRRQHQPELRH